MFEVIVKSKEVRMVGSLQSTVIPLSWRFSDLFAQFPFCIHVPSPAPYLLTTL